VGALKKEDTRKTKENRERKVIQSLEHAVPGMRFAGAQPPGTAIGAGSPGPLQHAHTVLFRVHQLSAMAGSRSILRLQEERPAWALHSCTKL
jgi:hypothetical protein